MDKPVGFGTAAGSSAAGAVGGITSLNYSGQIKGVAGQVAGGAMIGSDVVNQLAFIYTRYFTNIAQGIASFLEKYLKLKENPEFNKDQININIIEAVLKRKSEVDKISSDMNAPFEFYKGKDALEIFKKSFLMFSVGGYTRIYDTTKSYLEQSSTLNTNLNIQEITTRMNNSNNTTMKQFYTDTINLINLDSTLGVNFIKDITPLFGTLGLNVAMNFGKILAPKLIAKFGANALTKGVAGLISAPLVPILFGSDILSAGMGVLASRSNNLLGTTMKDIEGMQQLKESLSKISKRKDVMDIIDNCLGILNKKKEILELSIQKLAPVPKTMTENVVSYTIGGYVATAKYLIIKLNECGLDIENQKKKISMYKLIGGEERVGPNQNSLRTYEADSTLTENETKTLKACLAIIDNMDKQDKVFVREMTQQTIQSNQTKFKEENPQINKLNKLLNTIKDRTMDSTKSIWANSSQMQKGLVIALCGSALVYAIYKYGGKVKRYAKSLWYKITGNDKKVEEIKKENTNMTV